MRRWLTASTSAEGVAELRRALVVHPLRGLPHLPLQALDQRLGPPGEEEPRLLDRLVIGPLGGELRHAGAEAAVHVVIEAWTRPRAVDVDPADPHPEELLDQLDRLARQPAGEERPEILGAVVGDPASEGDARELVPHRQLQVRVGLVVPQQHVVARPLVLDPVVFEQQRLGLGIGDHVLQIDRFRDHRRQPRLMVARQVGRRPLAQ